MYTTCCALPLQLTDSSELAPIAFELATGSGRTVYDCLYLALAVKTKSIMVTADMRLANALGDTPLARRVVWIGDMG